MGELPQMTAHPSQQQFVVSDEALIVKLRAGQQAAGDELVRRYVQSLLAYLQRLTGSAAIAEDMHQQAWLSVLEHLDRFDEKQTPGGFRAWLFRIATNKVNDLWRSRARQHRIEEKLRHAGEEEMPDASLPMQSADQATKLQKAIERLPEAQRQVVCMRYYSNMRFVEIAAALGCPLNTALGRMHKALLKLRQSMELDS